MPNPFAENAVAVRGVLSGYYFFYFAFFGAFSPYFSLYLQSIAFSAWDIGLMLSQMQLMRLAGPYLWGWLSDRGYRRIAIVRFSGAVSLLGFLAFFALHEKTALFVAMTVLAFFWSAALPLMETLTFEHLREQAARYGRIRVWGSVGFIAAVLGVGVLLDHQPVRAVLPACAAMLAGILLFACLVPEAPSWSRTTTPVSVGRILKQRKVQALFAACFAMSAAHGAYYIFYSIHLARLGYDKLDIGLLWSLGVVAEILMFVAMPRLTQRFGLVRILFWSFVAAVLRFLLIAWCGGFAGLLWFAQILHAFTFGSYHASAIALVNRWFPGGSQARGQALYSSMSFGAGGLLGGVLAGAFWDRFGAELAYTLSAAFALLGVALVARVRRHEQTEAKPPV